MYDSLLLQSLLQCLLQTEGDWLTLIVPHIGVFVEQLFNYCAIFVKIQTKMPPFRTTFCAKVAGAQGLEPWAYGFGDHCTFGVLPLRRNHSQTALTRFITILLQFTSQNVFPSSICIKPLLQLRRVYIHPIVDCNGREPCRVHQGIGLIPPYAKYTLDVFGCQ